MNKQKRKGKSKSVGNNRTKREEILLTNEVNKAEA
jgi:hypothetical protein